MHNPAADEEITTLEEKARELRHNIAKIAYEVGPMRKAHPDGVGNLRQYPFRLFP